MAPEQSGLLSNQAINKAGITWQLVLSVAAAGMGALHFGWNTGVINNPKPSILSFLNDSTQSRYGAELTDYELELLWSACVSVFAIGGMFGALLGGTVADKVGRLRGMLLNCGIGLLAAAASGLSAVCNSTELLIGGRLITGFCSAMYTCLVPMYLTEVAPVAVRGALGVFNQLGVVIGLLLSQIISMDTALGSDGLWPIALSCSAIPCLAQLALLPMCPESPKHLLQMDRGGQSSASARAALVRLRSSEDVDAELEEMRQEVGKLENQQAMGAIELLGNCRGGPLLTPLIVGVVLHLSQQLSGINIIFYYSSDLFRHAGASVGASNYATVAVGGVMVAMTLVSVPLMEAAGRRTLHLSGLLGILLSSVCFTACLFGRSKAQSGWLADFLTYSSICAGLLLVLFFAVGPGSIPWLMVSELFAHRHRSAANGICVLVNWLANFTVGLLFPVLAQHLGSLLFLPFSISTCTFLLLLWRLMPETKGRRIEEIAAGF